MENYNLTLLQKMGMNNELKQRMLEAEGLKGVGVYLTFDHVLRHIKNYRIRLSIVPSIAQNLHTSVRYIMKIVRNYGLFVIDGEEFYSPEITDLMLRVRIKVLQGKEKKLQNQNKKSKGLSEIQELKNIKKDISITTKELYDSRKAAANMRTMINTISQFKLREREKEKRENAFGGRKENSLAARNFSQHEPNEGLAKDLNQAENYNQAEDLNQDEVGNQDDDFNQAEDLNQDEVGNQHKLRNLDKNFNQAEMNNQDKVRYQAKVGKETGLSKEAEVGKDFEVGKQVKVGKQAKGRNQIIARNQAKVCNQEKAINQANESNLTDELHLQDQLSQQDAPFAAESLKNHGQIPIKSDLQHSGEVKIWSDWADEMVNEDAYMERIANYSRLGKWFMPHRKQIVELFKEHVEIYSTSDGLITQNDVKYYFANFLRPETPTWKWVIEKLKEEEEARKAADPYRYEKRVNGVRMYPGGGEIPDDATPRPSMYAVWSEISKSWVGK